MPHSADERLDPGDRGAKPLLANLGGGAINVTCMQVKIDGF
jgi:hypothetical protein